MEGYDLGQVEVLCLDDRKYVKSESIFKMDVRTKMDFAHWFKYQIKKHNLKAKKDYSRSGEDILYALDTAIQIFENLKKPKPKKVKTFHGYPLDEDGLPIYPIAKMRELGLWINRYHI